MPDKPPQAESSANSGVISPDLLKTLGLDETAYQQWRSYVNEQISALDAKHGLAEENVNGGLVSEGESNKSSDRHYSKSKMKNSHSYNGTMDLMDTPLKPTWSSSGSYMERYHKSASNGFLTDGLGKGDKGYSLLPNKYPSSHGGGGSSTNGELPNLSSAFGHHNMNSGSPYGDFNSNLWSGHDDFYSNGSSKGFKGSSNNKGRGFDQSDSDHEPYGGGGSSTFRPSYQNHGPGEGHFIKISREYDEMMMTDDGKKDGLDSAGSTNTRDSGVSSLKSSKTIPSPPSMGASYESRQSGGGKMGGNKKRSPSPGTNGIDTLSNSRSWRSTPDVPELAKAEDELRKSGGGNDIGSDVSRSQSGSSGFLHRKPVLARASQRKASTDSIQTRINGLELRDYDDGTESEATIPGGGYVKEKTPKPVSYHLSLSTNNITNSEDDMDKSPSYSTSSLRRPANKQNGTKSYLKARSRSKTPVGNRAGLISSGMSSMKGGGDGDSIGSFNDLGGSSPTKTKTGAGGGGGKSIPSKRIYKGSFRETNAVKNAGGNAEVFPSDLKPVESPRHSLSLALNNLNSSEWETNLDGFKLLVRLTRHHPESLKNDLHNININGMRHLMNLRSQVCRSACLFFKELFLSQGKLMEQDVEKILEKLLDKSSDTNRFIREDSASAIETMVMQLTPAKILHCLDTYGLKHRNPIVRTTSARMLLLLIRRLGSERCLYDHPEKVLPMVCHFLQEGSLDTRTHAKAALAELITHTAFDAQLRRHVTPDALRNVSKIIQTIKSEVCKNKPELNHSAV